MGHEPTGRHDSEHARTVVANGCNRYPHKPNCYRNGSGGRSQTRTPGRKMLFPRLGEARATQLAVYRSQERSAHLISARHRAQISFQNTETTTFGLTATVQRRADVEMQQRRPPGLCARMRSKTSEGQKKRQSYSNYDDFLLPSRG